MVSKRFTIFRTWNGCGLTQPLQKLNESEAPAGAPIQAAERLLALASRRDRLSMLIGRPITKP